MARRHLRLAGGGAAAAADGGRDDVLLRQLCRGRDRIRAGDAASHPQRVARQLPLEHHELRRRRDRGRHSGRSAAPGGSLADDARVDSVVPHVSNLPHLSRAHRRGTAARCRVGRSCTGKHRGHCARFRPRTTTAARTSSASSTMRRRWRRGWSCWSWTRRRSRSRRCSTTSASSPFRNTFFPARSAHAERAEEDADSRAGRRRNRQRRAVSVPGGAAHPQPSRTLGREGLSGGTAG